MRMQNKSLRSPNQFLAVKNLAIVIISLAMMTLVVTGALAQSDLRTVSTKIVKDMVTDSDVAKLAGEKLVVAEFENINGKGNAVPRIFQEMLTTAFIKDKHFKVIERAQLEKALKELKISTTGLVDPENAKKIGKMLGAAFMVVGSISDLGGKASIDARIVNIESGESVTAADATIDSSEPPSATPSGSKPSLNMNEQGNNNSAGQTVGQTENFGLLSGTKFKVAWRENLGSVTATKFASGNVAGDSFPRLVTNRTTGPPQFMDTLNTWLEVAKWTGEKFQCVWKSQSNFYFKEDGVLTVAPVVGQPAPILLPGLCVYQWNGTSYSEKQKGCSYHISGWINNGTWNVFGNNRGYIFIAQYEFNSEDLTSWTESAKTIGSYIHPKTLCAANDLDGDGQIEFAVVNPSISIGEPIEIYGMDGSRKAVTDGKYGSLLTTWQPGNIKHPYLIARINSHDEDKKSNGGTIHFIQWNGETYDEIWKSNKIDDAVLDMKVCDPKGEGKDGLVILSRDKKNSYLTKIIAE